MTIPLGAEPYTISQLARSTRIPIPRIKFYLREGLLPSADLRAEKRAFYDRRHAQRLRLIHTLRQVADLPVPAIRDVCEALDRPGGAAPADVIVRVLDAVATRPRGARAFDARATAGARRELYTMLSAHGVRVRPNARALDDLSRALLGLRDVIDPALPVQTFVPYLDAMCRLAEQDYRANEPLLAEPAQAGLAAALGTVLWEPVLLLLRRIAHEHVAGQRLGQRRRGRARRRS